VPLRRADGGTQLLALDASAQGLVGGAEGLAVEDAGDLEAALPQEQDIPGISDLLIEGFYRVLAKKLLSEEQWGPLATLWNTIFVALEREIVRIGLGQNLGRVLLRPSILRPPGRSFEGHGLGLMLVQRGRPDAAPVAFCELCLLPNDGRQADDTAEVIAMLSLDPLDATAQPYLLNFCVAKEFRRRGIGRSLLHLAEDIVQRVWGGKRLYLHATDDEAASALYTSAGYELVGSRRYNKGEAMHMCKRLAPVREEGVHG